MINPYNERITVVPFSVLPYNLARTFGKSYRGIGGSISSLFPILDLDLAQANIDYKKDEYLTIGLLNAAITTIFLTLAIIFLLYISKNFEYWFLGLIIIAFCSIFIMLSIIYYPKMLVRKKIRETETNLIYALRTMSVSLNSGLSLFQSMTIIAQGNYGEVSKEFTQIVKNVNSGKLEEDAISEVATTHPSSYFKRVLWQLIIAMKGGSEITSVVQRLLDALTKDELIQIQRYGAKLRMISLMYMMMGIIIPALGITFLILLSSFPQLNLGEMSFWILLVIVLIINWGIMQNVKMSRPALLEN